MLVCVELPLTRAVVGRGFNETWLAIVFRQFVFDDDNKLKQRSTFAVVIVVVSKSLVPLVVTSVCFIEFIIHTGS